MAQISLDKLNAGYKKQIVKWEEERDHAAKSGWYEKAAKYDVLIEGLTKAKFLANSGDYHA